MRGTWKIAILVGTLCGLLFMSSTIVAFLCQTLFTALFIPLAKAVVGNATAFADGFYYLALAISSLLLGLLLADRSPEKLLARLEPYTLYIRDGTLLYETGPVGEWHFRWSSPSEMLGVREVRTDAITSAPALRCQLWRGLTCLIPVLAGGTRESNLALRRARRESVHHDTDLSAWLSLTVFSTLAMIVERDSGSLSGYSGATLADMLATKLREELRHINIVVNADLIQFDGQARKAT